MTGDKKNLVRCLTTFLTLIPIYIMFSSAWHLSTWKTQGWWVNADIIHVCLIFECLTDFMSTFTIVAIKKHCLLHKLVFKVCSHIWCCGEPLFSSIQIWWYILQISVVKATQWTLNPVRTSNMSWCNFGPT